MKKINMNDGMVVYFETQRIEKLMYKAIKAGQFDKADKLRQRYVDLNVQSMKLRGIVG